MQFQFEAFERRNDFSYLTQVLQKWCCMDGLNLSKINTDCVLHILQYVEFDDLLNIADTCTSLRFAACYFFERKCSGKKIVGIGDIEQIWKRCLEPALDGKETSRQWRPADVIASKPLMALKLLRNFGPAISNLHITSFSRKLMEKLESYLVKYCVTSLENVLLTGCSLRLLCLKAPFINIESIVAYQCQFQDSLPFGSNFPKLKSLTLLVNNEENCAKIAFHSPALTHLTYIESKTNYRVPDEVSIYRTNEFVELLKLNPQIEQLKLFRLTKTYSLDILQCICEHLPNLRSLTLCDAGSKFFENFSDIFYSKSVEHFELLSTGSAELRYVPFLFPNLKSLIVNIHYTMSSTKFVFDFMANHNKLKSIHITGIDRTYRELLEFRRIPTGIEELTIDFCYDFPIYKIITLLKGREKLKKFSVKGVFPERTTLHYAVERVCLTMTIFDIPFEVRPIDNNESETVELHINTELQTVIKLSSSRCSCDRESIDQCMHTERIEMHWYNING